MIEVAYQEASDRNISNIGITGGVSYNLPIVRMVKDAVEKRGLTLIMHNNVPNGDGGISIGQNAIAGNILEGRV
jgi:hydrogenase maturation protein HypF